MSDTDRIIAAQAAQAHKTRVLLVWLLVGVPLAAGIVWAGIYFLAVRPAHNPGAGTGSTPTVDSRCVYVDGQPDLYDAYCQTHAP